MNIETILKSNGKSITDERKEIFNFIQTKHIFSAQEILEEFPTLGRASIFRTIRLFLEIRILRRLTLGERSETYEINETEHHHEHMKCTICQNIMSFDSHSICKKIFEEAKKQGFIIQEHSLSIIGKCQKCTSLS
jgi:Fur family ferric uptake transcriptional regulator